MARNLGGGKYSFLLPIMTPQPRATKHPKRANSVRRGDREPGTLSGRLRTCRRLTRFCLQVAPRPAAPPVLDGAVLHTAMATTNISELRKVSSRPFSEVNKSNFRPFSKLAAIQGRQFGRHCIPNYGGHPRYPGDRRREFPAGKVRRTLACRRGPKPAQYSTVTCSAPVDRRESSTGRGAVVLAIKLSTPAKQRP